MKKTNLDLLDTAIREYVGQHEGAYPRQIAHALGKPDNTMRWRLLELEARKILRSGWDHGRKKYYLEK